MSEITYKDSGVDIEVGDRFVELITPLAKRTFRPGVIGGIGAFSALFKLDNQKYKNPVLVSGTDGVGTKLKIAFMTGVHNTVGIDLVAMCVNDVLICGAEPLFFLDYFATGKLDTETAVKVVEGIATGCKDAGCALVGGETAEMPGFYPDGEYDLSGFAVGAVEEDSIINGSSIKEGDMVIGLSSSGLHSNGYSLVRKIFFEKERLDVNDRVDELGSALGEELLKPTEIYVKAYEALKGNIKIKGMAHITGGGIPGNLPRVLPEGVSAFIDESSWPVPPVFNMLKKMGNVSPGEMRSTFNMGMGYIIIADGGSADEAIRILGEKGYKAYLIGEIRKGGKDVVYKN